MPRHIGPTKENPVPVNPDTIISYLMTANTCQAFDIPANSDYCRVSAGTTAAGFETIFINFGSTKASVPTTAAGLTTQGSSFHNIPVGLGEGRVFQIARATTGFSLISVSSMYACVEFWTRGGATST